MPELISMTDRPTDEVCRFIRSVWPAYVWDATGPGPSLEALVARWGSHGWLLLAEDRVVAAANSVPLDVPATLPDEGWDWAVRVADERGADRCALMVTVAPDHQRQGLSKRLLRTMTAATTGRLIIPVRPPSKQIDQPIEALLQAPREDPWLRTHLALGAWILGPCHRSMVLEAPLEDWARWGERGRIAPVVPVGDRGRYVEPNVWVEHPTG